LNGRTRPPILAELGQRDEACEAFRKAIEIEPSDGRVYYNVADTLEEMGFGAEAVSYWRAYLLRDRTSQWAGFARSRIG
jgi:tetratricopeptide (TPR) repeat protein